MREKVARGRIRTRFANVASCLIGIEAGLATHYIARELLVLGHDVRHVRRLFADDAGRNRLQSFHFNNSYVLTADTAVLSNVISNVPAVLALKPFVLGLSDRNRIWLVMAMRDAGRKSHAGGFGG